MTDSLWYDPNNNRPIIKEELGISATDTKFDDLLDSYGVSANRRIDNMIFPHKDTVPVEDENVTHDLKEAARLYVIYHYKLKNKSFEAVKLYKEEFEAIIDSVISRYRAGPEGRTDIPVEASRYRSEPLRSRERFFG